MAKRSSTEKQSRSQTTSKSSPKAASAGQWRWLDNLRLQAIILAMFSFALYAQTISYQYALDDKIVISENRFVKEGFAGIPNILSRSSFDGHKAAEAEKDKLSGGRYRPLSLVMFALEYQVSGGKPWLPHLVNVLMNAGVVVLIFYLLHLLIQGHATLARYKLLPLAAALLFAAHPAHTEVVANIKSRDELLCLLLSLASLYSFVQYCRAGSSGLKPPALKYLAFSTGWMLLALLAKESATTFLFVLPFAAWFFAPATEPASDSANEGSLRSPIQSVAVGMIPIVVVTGIFLMLRTSIVGFIDDSHVSPSIFDNPFVRATTSERYSTAIAMLGRYLLYTFYPVNLSHEYSYNELDIVTWSHWQTLLSLAVHGGLIAFAVLKVRERHIIAFCVGYYIATISIVSNIVFNIGTLFGERFLFMPSVASCIAYGWLVCWLLAVRGAESAKQRVSWAVALGAVILVAGVYTWRVVKRNPVWENENTLVYFDVLATPNSLRNRRVFTGFLMRDAQATADPAVREHYLNTAYENMQFCIQADPTVDDKAHFNLGQYFGMFRLKSDSALYYYSKAHELNPKDSMTHVYYTFNKGNYYLDRQQYDTAIALYKSVLDWKIEMETLYYNIAVANLAKGNFAEALPWYEKALTINPQNPNSQAGYANCKQQLALAQQRGQASSSTKK